MANASTPAGLGCWSTWNESFVDPVIRTDMESGAIKSRRRFTASVRTLEASVRLPKDRYNDFVAWYQVACRSGIVPAELKNPLGVTEAWAFASPPNISSPDPNVFEATCSFYRLPSFSP